MTPWALSSACALAALVCVGAVSAGGARSVASPLLYAGDAVDGLPLTAVLRPDETAGYVAFVHGDCVASDDAGCAPPAEIQVWPACRRHLGLYERAPPAGPVVERAVVRGVPAAFVDGGARIELQTGRSTVVVFASSRARALRIAEALRSIDGSVPAGLPLPEPVSGALDGTAPC
jgi:hypothetical protein